MKLFLIIATLSGTVAAVDSSDEVCLLGLRHSVRRTEPAAVRPSGKQRVAFSDLFEKVEERRAKLKAWGDSFRAKADVALPVDQLQDFIKAQDLSSDACHAKMLESKRTMDGLLQKVKQLGLEVDGENSIIEGNTATIKDALQKKKEAEETKAKETEECIKIAEESRKEELTKIQKEITQMRQIADPQVRSRVKFDTDYSEKATAIADKLRADAKMEILSQGVSDEERDEIMKNAASLTQVATKFTLTKNDLLSLVSVDLGRCKDLKNLIDEVDRSHSLHLMSPECEEARSNLQKEFTIAFNEITSLYDRTAEEINTKLEQCKQKAHMKFTEAEEEVKQMTKEATDNIAKAKETIEGLDPVIEESQESIDTLRQYIKEMEEECKTDEDVSTHLEKIQDLITELEECPGKNDFILDIPEWTAAGAPLPPLPEQSAAEVPAAAVPISTQTQSPTVTPAAAVTPIATQPTVTPTNTESITSSTPSFAPVNTEAASVDPSFTPQSQTNPTLTPGR